MEATDLYKILEKTWSKKYIYLLLIISYILFNLPFITSYNISSKKTWIIAIAILVVHIIAFGIILWKRAIPKFKEDESGILFLFDIEDEKYRSLINEKFVKEMGNKFRPLSSTYKTMMPNKFIFNKIYEKYLSKGDYDGLKNKTKYKIAICGRCVIGGEKEKISCKLNIDGIISDSPMNTLELKILYNDIVSVFKPIKNILIYKETETEDFSKNALQLNYAIDYVFASTLIFFRNFEKSLDEFLDLHSRIITCKQNIPVVSFIKSVIDGKIAFCSNNLAAKELNEFYIDKDITHLTQMINYLSISNEHSYNNYDYKLLVAIYYFISDRDVKTALSHIEDCSNITKDNGWKFSKVFLKLYQKDSMSNFIRAYREYSKSFEKRKKSFGFVIDIIDFIIRILDEEPEKKQLNFLLFLLYYYIGDEIFSKQYYHKFADSYPHLLANKNFSGILKKLDISNDIEQEVKETEDTPNE